VHYMYLKKVTRNRNKYYIGIYIIINYEYNELCILLLSFVLRVTQIIIFFFYNILKVELKVRNIIKRVLINNFSIHIMTIEKVEISTIVAKLIKCVC